MTPTATPTPAPTPAPTDKPKGKTTRERLAAPGNTFDMRGYYLWVWWGEHGRTLMLRRGADGQEETDWPKTRTVCAALTDPELPTPGRHDRPHAQYIERSEVHDGEIVHILDKKGRTRATVTRHGRRWLK